MSDAIYQIAVITLVSLVMMFVIPFMVYRCIKFATFARFMGKWQAEQYVRGRKKDGDQA